MPVLVVCVGCVVCGAVVALCESVVVGCADVVGACESVLVVVGGACSAGGACVVPLVLPLVPLLVVFAGGADATA